MQYHTIFEIIDAQKNLNLTELQLESMAQLPKEFID